ncbi:Hcp family type VI secretion system effector [uncultured Brachyspira sp.]|uniref:Hcp family type VI secretion system effector n=1 Tax=uncultured Brachyspira sp. TaxID=221953 RepID=UPI0026204A35|nr:Hcp family type VI secretion system effector [uncultured Brachyspira sp.]MDT3693955.1 Hcp family type VI secretion system effector [Mucispirillum sp.]
MSSPVYIKIEGATQGLITSGASTEDSIGNRYQAGHEDEIMAQEIIHTVTVPTDTQSGQPSGQRVHKPFVFTCSLNKSVPLLYNALTKGEKLNNVEVHWYRTAVGGGQEHYFSTIFEDAVITDISLLMPNAQEPGNSDKTEEFKVSLNYRKIVWEHVASGTSGSDDWRNA